MGCRGGFQAALGFWSGLSGSLAKPVLAYRTLILFCFPLQVLGFQRRLSEQVLDVEVLSPALDSPTCKVSVIRERPTNTQVKYRIVGH